MKNKYLLLCGAVASLLYIAADIYVSSRYPGYSYKDQAISELSAVGAPTKGLWTILLILFDPLLVAFGLGVRKAAASNRPLGITGLLIVVWGLFGLLWYLFPMNMNGNIGSATDTMHLVMSAVTVFLIITFIGIGSGSGGRWFRLYSLTTIVLMLIFGAMVGQQAPRVARQLPTPWMGIMERISVYAPMVWVIVLSRRLIQINPKQAG